MEFHRLFDDDDAVSPVIGVILMVAVTVILAAVIAAFVLGFGESDDVGPSTSFDYEYSDIDGQPGGELTIKVQAGDSFVAERVSFSGADIGDFESADHWGEGPLTPNVNPESRISSGQRITGDVDDEEFEIDIIWTSDDSESSNIIASTAGPAP